MDRANNSFDPIEVDKSPMDMEHIRQYRTSNSVRTRMELEQNVSQGKLSLLEHWIQFPFTLDKTRGCVGVTTGATSFSVGRYPILVEARRIGIVI